MSKPRSTRRSPKPVYDPDPAAVYTIDVVVRLTGLPPQAILLYQEEGLISPVATGPRGVRKFDDEALRTLRRIDYLRSHYEMNLRALKLTLTVLGELERLRDGLHRGRRDQ